MNKVLSVKYNTLCLFCFNILVAFIMHLVMYTAKDRESYLEHFANPFYSSRIEIGFQYYMFIYKIIGVLPQIGVIITSVIIYTLLAKVWFFFIKTYWLESILLFNFLMFTLFNYYLGTSLRMGLAVAICLYASIRIFENKWQYWILLAAAATFHYGAILYLIIFCWVRLSRQYSLRYHFFAILVASLFAVSVFKAIFPELGLSSYYLNYLDNEEISSRFIPFSLLFLILSLFALIFKKKSNKFPYSLYLLVLYSIPFLIGTFIGGVVLFPKMITPLIFLAAILFVIEYYNKFQKLTERNLRFMVLIYSNFTALLYALNMYQYI